MVGGVNEDMKSSGVFQEAHRFGISRQGKSREDRLILVYLENWHIQSADSLLSIVQSTKINNVGNTAVENPTVIHAIRSVPILRNHSGLSICNTDHGMFRFMILASDSRHKRSNDSFLGSPVVDEERMRYEADE